jgi:two-component sensor histidine kinase
LKRGPPFSEEYRLTLPDGSTKYIKGTAEATLGPGGKPVLVHGSLRDITERKLAEEQIMCLLAEKELILREVHHRIKNNMNTMMSLLSLQADIAKEPSVAAALRDASNRMMSMSTLYEKLYRSENIQDLSISEYLPALVDEIIANIPSRITIRVVKQVDDFMLKAKTLSIIGIIVNELITNALKYAFAGRDDGIITVTATLKDNHAAISVADNGKGLPESIDFTASTGFGLQLAGLLAVQLKGTIRIERQNGTRFVLEFPASG